MSTNIFKEHFSKMAIKLREIATEIADTGILNLKPGTYTAAQIHYELKRKDGDYFERNLYADTHTNEPEKEVNIMHKMYEVSDEFGIWRFPGGNVFKMLKEAEKASGMTRNNAHRIHIPDCRRMPVAVTQIEFPSKKTMANFSLGVRKLNVYKRKYCIFSLYDGGLRGRGTTYRYNASGKKYIDLQSPYRASPLSYDGIEQAFQNLSFLIDGKLIKYLHGICKIALYQDMEHNEGNNPLHTRVMITNEDGWSISSDILLDFKANEFDEKFDFEPIGNTTTTWESEHTENRDGDNKYTGTQRITNHAEPIPVSKGVDGNHAKDVSLLQSIISKKVSTVKNMICRDYGKNSIPAQNSKKISSSKQNRLTRL